MDYSQFAEKPVSEKVVLAHMGAAQRLLSWALYSGSIYSKATPEFVVGVTEAGTALVQVASLAAVNSAGKWFFDATAKTLYVRTTGSVDPSNVFLRADYRIFLSTAPVDLPFDLSAGTEVEYLPIIQGTAQFGYEIDLEQFGVALEGQGEIALENTDGYWDSRFERYWWENKTIQVYSWSPVLPLSEKRLIYRGLLAAKGFSESTVSFGLRDFIALLNNQIALPLMDGTEGDVQEAVIGSAKRRIYGRASGLRCVGIDHVLDGFEMTGTITAVAGDTVLTGSGTAFMDEMTPEDTLFDGENTYKVKSVDSNTQITISSDLETNLTATTFMVRPKIPWRKKNRRWLIAGHALKKIQTTVDTAVQLNRILVDDATDFEIADVILVDGVRAIIRRISGNLLILEQNLPGAPSPGDEVSKYPVQAANQGTRDFVFVRDFTITNGTTAAVLELDDLAEFNTARPLGLTGSVTFTNGSRTVSGSGSLFLSQVKPRDWVRTDLGTWYEVLQVVSDTSLLLRVSFGETTAVSSASERRALDLIDDEAVITVNCYGKTVDGTEDGVWIKSGPQAVKDLISEAGLADAIDATSFTEAHEEADYTLSLKLPLEYISQEIPSIKDAIDLINQSVMGAVHFNQDFELEYSVLNSKKPPELVALQDDDIIGWSVSSRVDHIIQEMICRYRHEDAERFSGEPSQSYQSRVNEIAQRLSDSKATRTLDTYLYREEDAQIIAQRYALYAESASSRITIQAKLNLSTRPLAGKVYLNLDRLFYRLGSQNSRRKIGMVVSVKKDGMDTVLEVEDISGLWNKVANIADDSSLEFDAASDDERARNGYLTDDNGIVTTFDWTYRTNLIG